MIEQSRKGVEIELCKHSNKDQLWQLEPGQYPSHIVFDVSKSDVWLSMAIKF